MHIEKPTRRRSAPTMLFALLFLLGTAFVARATVVPQPHFTLNGIAGLDAHGIVAAWTSSHGANHFTAEITWGDGEPNGAGTVSSNGQKSFDAQGTHAYAAAGTYNGSVHVVDTIDDASADIAFTAEIRTTGLIPLALTADEVDDGDTDSDFDGVFEFGESVALNPTWGTNGANINGVAGTLSDFTRVGMTAGETYTLTNDAATYGNISKTDSHDCYGHGGCYKLAATLTGPRPVAHMDAQVTETVTGDAAPIPKTWTLHMGGSFADVVVNSMFYRNIETILHNNVTTGVTATTFGPKLNVTRGQMAAFLARGFTGGDELVPATGSVNAQPYDCTLSGTSLFADVAPSSPFCRHIHYIASKGITLGCVDGSIFCPSLNIKRGEAAVFLARSQPPNNPGGDADVPMVYGPDLNTGRSYDCNVATADVPFSDVSASHPFCKYISYVWARGIVDGFGDGTFRPNFLITREQMAKLLNLGLDLTLYHP